MIYDQTDLVTNIIYYKHPDGSYDTSNTNRIIPVIYGMTSVAAVEGGTFASAAKEAADKQFDTDSINNLIELTVQNDDELVSQVHSFKQEIMDHAMPYILFFQKVKN